jgi:hypothetical protein
MPAVVSSKLYDSKNIAEQHAVIALVAAMFRHLPLAFHQRSGVSKFAAALARLRHHLSPDFEERRISRA